MVDNNIAIHIAVAQGDVLAYHADVLALKFAQQLYGVDKQVARRLSTTSETLYSDLPQVGDTLLVSSLGKLGSSEVLFVGVRNLFGFGYREIRDFGRSVLAALALKQPNVRHICLTLHGAGVGLDEAEAFKSEVAGLVDAIASLRYPPRLERVTFVEENPRRAERLQQILGEILPSLSIVPDASVTLPGSAGQASETFRTSGYRSEEKQHVFVAMSFDEGMTDVFHYGIERSVHAAGPLCERADTSTFTGEVMAWVKDRIAAATLVIAELSGANPNVYLEVGYAWGCNIPTVLVVRDSGELKFDVKSHRCIVYKSIHDLETRLTSELKALLL